MSLCMNHLLWWLWPDRVLRNFIKAEFLQSGDNHPIAGIITWLMKSATLLGITINWQDTKKRFLASICPGISDWSRLHTLQKISEGFQ